MTKSKDERMQKMNTTNDNKILAIDIESTDLRKDTFFGRILSAMNVYQLQFLMNEFREIQPKIFCNPVFDYDCDLCPNMLTCHLMFALRSAVTKEYYEKIQKGSN